MSAGLSPRFGFSWQMRVMMQMHSELGSGVVCDVGGHTECLRDGICLESESEVGKSESEVGKGVPLQQRGMCVCTSSRSNWKPSVRSDNVFWVSISLAMESARACSTAARRSSSELGACCCAGFIASENLRGDPRRRNTWDG